MLLVKFTGHLKRFFPTLVDTEIEATTVAQVIAALDAHYPGMASYLG